MISFPYDNQSETVQDRNIDSDAYAKYMDRMVGTNGIFLELGTKLEVTAGEGMTVLVKPGDGIITGHFFIEEDARELQVQASESLDRIDTVVLRHDAEKRMIDLYVVKGTSATVPQPPELTREGGIYELGIANVYVPKLTDSIAQERITDTRLNTERCGVAPVLGGIDTQGLYDQYQASLDAFLELVETAIDGTTAGHLQSLIDSQTVRINQIDADINISEETTEDFEALGWTPIVGEAVIESLLDWISQHAKFKAESGVTNGWTWVKYTDGTCEMWARHPQADQESVRVGDLVNGMYRGFITVPYPVKLIDGVVDAVFNNSNCFAAGSSLMLEESKVRVALQSGQAVTTNTTLDSCFIKGKYK